MRKAKEAPHPITVPPKATPVVQEPPPPPRELPRSRGKSFALVGVSAGIGNAIFTLPLIKVAHDLGYGILLYSDTDYRTRKLFERCIWIDQTYSDPDPLPKSDLALAGPFCPKAMLELPFLSRTTWMPGQGHPEPEWRRILRSLEPYQVLKNLKRPDVTNWCRWLNRTKRFDFGIVPGCKPGSVWAKKRYPPMRHVGQSLLDKGHTVAVFGSKDDQAEKIPGENFMGKLPLQDLPDALASCRVLIGVDNGPMHIGASLGIPSVIIYTAVSEVKGDPVGPPQFIRKVYPRGLSCRPCAPGPLWHECTNWKCRKIDPARVIVRALELLSGVNDASQS